MDGRIDGFMVGFEVEAKVGEMDGIIDGFIVGKVLVG